MKTITTTNPLTGQVTVAERYSPKTGDRIAFNPGRRVTGVAIDHITVKPLKKGGQS